MRGKRGEPSRTGPVERDVLARIRRPLKLIAERIDGTDRRFAPGHELSGSGLGARRVNELWIFSRQTCRAGQGLGPRLHFAGDLRSPIGAVGRDLEGDLCAFHAPHLPAFVEQRSDESRKSSDLAAENAGEHFRLALVGAIVDEEAGATLGLSCPEIAFPSSYPDEAQTVEREDLGGGRLSLQLSKPKSEPWTLRQSILSAEGASFGQGEARSLRRSAKDALPTKEEQELLSAQKLLDPPWR